MLGISVVTPQCLTVGKAGLATNHTPLTAMLVFCCSHPVELQQQQQKGLEAKDSTFKYYSASKIYLSSICKRGPASSDQRTVSAWWRLLPCLKPSKWLANLCSSKWEGLVGEMYCLGTPEREITDGDTLPSLGQQDT